jgi:hypothetical protein
MTNPDGPERDSLGPEIRRLRLTAGLTLEELSTLTGIREPYLAAIEDGREGVESGRERPDTQSHASRDVTTTSGPVTEGSSRAVTLGGALLALFLLLVLACAVPFFAGVSNLIGLVIIGIGMYQAWKLNRRGAVVISGPHALTKPQESPAVV